jgi:hypothetical protein
MLPKRYMYVAAAAIVVIIIVIAYTLWYRKRHVKFAIDTKSTSGDPPAAFPGDNSINFHIPYSKELDVWENPKMIGRTVHVKSKVYGNFDSRIVNWWPDARENVIGVHLASGSYKATEGVKAPYPAAGDYLVIDMK